MYNIFRRNLSSGINYVPKHKAPNDKEIELLIDFLKNSNKLFVITGAGVSTESGLPDYRSEGTGLVARIPNFKPTNYQDFMRKESTRRIYWTRSFAAWNYHIRRKPNINHYSLASWEDKGRINSLVTQNVDRLHQKAGSKNVIELHGTLYQVRCMKCENLIDRNKFQNILREINKNIEIEFETKSLRPDGDIDLKPEVSSKFKVPDCNKCSVGILKPNVVFYGENVPSSRKEAVRDSIHSSDSVLIMGTTLHTRSGRDHVEYANKIGLPIGIINIGPTFADHCAQIIVNAKCGDVMQILAQENIVN